jgi:flagellar hook-associated protein 3 FlgL
MRVTDGQAFDAMRRQVTKARSEAVRAQEVASTGLNVLRPSDDPIAAASARREQARMAIANGAVSNARAATMQLEATEQSLGDAYFNLAEARTLAVEGATAGMPDNNRTELAVQVRKIREQMVNAANTNIGGKYVFAGYLDEQLPFDASGDFQGDESTKEVQALRNVRLQASINGVDAFGTGSDSVFVTLDNLATALEAGDLDAIRGSLATIDVSARRLSDARVRAGAMLNNVDTAIAVADRSGYNSQQEIARLTEADQFESATNLIKAKSALDAAIVVAQQIPVAGLVQGSR